MGGGEESGKGELPCGACSYSRAVMSMGGLLSGAREVGALGGACRAQEKAGSEGGRYEGQAQLDFSHAGQRAGERRGKGLTGMPLYTVCSPISPAAAFSTLRAQLEKLQEGERSPWWPLLAHCCTALTICAAIAVVLHPVEPMGGKRGAGKPWRGHSKSRKQPSSMGSLQGPSLLLPSSPISP